MPDSLPLLSISLEQLQALIAAMLVYQLYRRKKTPATEGQRHTLRVLEYLLPKLYYGTNREVIPLYLTFDDICVMKGGLTALLDRLKKQPPLPLVKREIQRLEELKNAIEHTFLITQD